MSKHADAVDFSQNPSDGPKNAYISHIRDICMQMSIKNRTLKFYNKTGYNISGWTLSTGFVIKTSFAIFVAFPVILGSKIIKFVKNADAGEFGQNPSDGPKTHIYHIYMIYECLWGKKSNFEILLHFITFLVERCQPEL